MSGQFIDLHRTFYELGVAETSSRQGAEVQLVRSGRRFDWNDLSLRYRVVMLAEAGAGKTKEIRQVAERLRGEGKAAFFVRLEHVAAGETLDGAFEVGDAGAFKEWLDSTIEGWLFLDSIDESKLRHPGDFDRAIRNIGVVLGPAKERCHIVVTGRTPAWRPSSDKSMGALSDRDNSADKSPLTKLVPDWKELNRLLFWRIVLHAREAALAKGEAMPASWWSYGLYESFVKFEPGDFDHVLDEVVGRPSEADKRVALSLACRLYLERGRHPRDRGALWASIGQSEVLGSDLNAFMHPRVTPEDARLRRMNREHSRRAKERQQQEKKNFQKSIEILRKHVDLLRESPLSTRGIVSNNQHYLMDQMRSADNGNNNWSSGDWRALIGTFGEEVALAFRDGAMAFWRNHRPILRSEGAVANSTPISVVFGLCGLAIEAAARQDWVALLTADDAEIATRYAIHELNGFPAWLPSLYRRFPEVVLQLFLQEIEYELAHEKPDDKQPSFYLLYDVSWSGEWIRDRIAPRLFDLAQVREPQHYETLEHLLTILQASSLSDSALADLGREKVKSLQDNKRIAHWAAVWVGADAGSGLGWVTSRLEQLDPASALQFCMTFLVDLVGARDSRLTSRRTFMTPVYLKHLYLMARKRPAIPS